jgi:hypothetical protein
MLIEIASLIIINTRAIDASIDNNNLGNNNSGYNYFVPGDSRLQIEQREREAAERAEQSRRETIARERAERASRGSSYTASGYDIKVVGTSYAQCVIYYKQATGKSESLGYAGNIKPKTQEAKVGYGALEKGIGHISLVIAVYDNSIRVRESNYLRGFLTERTIDKTDIKGYYY